MTRAQFDRFRQLVYKESGINLHQGKLQLLKARLTKRLRQIGLLDTTAYLHLLERDRSERMAFIDVIATNHTFFFREDHHFQYLHKAHRHIWCAACASGEEPYSIAIYCKELGFEPQILATDISNQVLQTARQAIYPQERIKKVPQLLLKRYFQKGCGEREGYVRLKPAVARVVSFKRLNLITDALPAQMFDVLFCRNVMIYFDHHTKQHVVNKLNQSLRPGGYFIIGGAESLNNIKHSLAYIKPSVYQKQCGAMDATGASAAPCA